MLAQRKKEQIEFLTNSCCTQHNKNYQISRRAIFIY